MCRRPSLRSKTGAFTPIVASTGTASLALPWPTSRPAACAKVPARSPCSWPATCFWAIAPPSARSVASCSNGAMPRCSRGRFPSRISSSVISTRSTLGTACMGSRARAGTCSASRYRTSRSVKPQCWRACPRRRRRIHRGATERARWRVAPWCLMCCYAKAWPTAPRFGRCATRRYSWRARSGRPPGPSIRGPWKRCASPSIRSVKPG